MTFPYPENCGDIAAEREYDSGWTDGARGLSFIPGESDAYNRGYNDGTLVRLERDLDA